MALAINIMEGHGLSNKVCHKQMPKEKKVMLYQPLISYKRRYLNANAWTASKQSTLVEIGEKV